MYKGTLIADLMAAVQQAEQQAQQHDAWQQELHDIFSMQIPVNDEQFFKGAA